jgi:serine/threonine protein kinase
VTERTDETLEAVDQESSDRVGSVLKETYELVGFLGEGGFGSVYRGIQHPIERSVAVKILDLPQRGARKRFLREAKVVASLTHPAAVTIYDYGTTDDGCPFMVMEFLDGRDLEVELQEGPVSPARLAKLLPDVLDALAQAHGQGLVHRDLKPSNLFVVNPGGDERLKLLDFGIAGFADTEDAPGPGMGKLTVQGGIVGTPQYLAPEYIRDQTVTPALDVYQMGLIIAEALSGTPAVNEPSLISCAQKHLAGELAISEATFATPVFGPIVRIATATEPEDRYPDAGAMLVALREASEGMELPRTSAETRMKATGGRVATVAESAVVGPRTVFEDVGGEPSGAPAAAGPRTVFEEEAASQPAAASSASLRPMPTALAPPPKRSSSGAGFVAVAIGAVTVLILMAVVVVAAVGWYAGRSEEPVVVHEDAPQPKTPREKIVPPPARVQEGLAGTWRLTTEVLGPEDHSGLGVHGFYKLVVDSDLREAGLTKTGFTNKVFERSKRQSGRARLRPLAGGAFAMHPTLRAKRKTLDLTMVLVPNGESFSGYWQYRTKSYDRAGLWGVLATSRTDSPNAPNAGEHPCLVKCLVARQKLRPRSTPQMQYCTADCKGR